MRPLDPSSHSKDDLSRNAGNFSLSARTNRTVQRLVPPPIRRSFALLRSKVRGTFADTPVLFFAVVIGVALTFRVAIGWARDAQVAPAAAPTFTTAAPAAPTPDVTGGSGGSGAGGHDESVSGASATGATRPGSGGGDANGAGSRAEGAGAARKGRGGLRRDPQAGEARPAATVAPRPRGHGRRPFGSGG